MHQDLYDPLPRLDRTLARIREATHADRRPATVSVQHLPGEPEPFADVVRRPFRPCRPGDRWGRAWSTSWFHITADVASDEATTHRPQQRVELQVDLGFTQTTPGFQAEGLVHDASGRVLKGLEPRNRHVPVAGDQVDVYVEAAANPTVLVRGFPRTSLGDVGTASDEPLYVFGGAELVVVEQEVEALGHDVELLLSCVRSMLEGDPRRARVLTALLRSADRLDAGDVSGTAAEARAALAPVLADPASASAHRVSAVGHAHIDSAWLWPVRETVRKCARTFSNVLTLAEERPELRFACSSAQQYAWMAEHYPELFERIRQAVADGSFVPVGGMWVESDTNLPGGEAMARQLVHGKRFFRERLGVECEEVWLPDSFGYAGSLPQLARLAGSRWFLSQKMSWNQTSAFPHHTFWWEGIDGSRVFTHFPPTDTYNAQVTPDELVRGQSRFKEAGAASRSLLLFGYGDGGGGPTREMLERAERLRDLEGMPRVVVETPARFFAGAEEEYAAQAPVWAGEMYLEYHRGVYTSQVEMKQGNRRVEHLLREAELWSALDTLRCGADYPYDELERLWRTALLLQFHDILPGSSIAWVHREARDAYAHLTAELEDLVARSLASLAGDGQERLAVNSGPFEVTGVPPLGGGIPGPETGEQVAVEPRDDGGVVLQNQHLRLVVDGRGLLCSVVDRAADREVLAGPANLLQLHPDTPNRFDAWDVEPHYRARVTDLDAAESLVVTTHEDGGAEVRVVRRSGPSTFTQSLRLAPAAARVDLETEVDWQHEETLLKAAFPLAVHAERSTAEIGYGHVHRPTHPNTATDAAQFEICAHRWLHVGEPGYGVAVVSTTTYGYDVGRGAGGDRRAAAPTTVRLSLVRAPRFPDPDTDRGVHRFRYTLVPGVEVPGAVAEGYRAHLPLRAVSGSGDRLAPALRVDGPGVVEAVKLAEDHSGDVVVRLYEPYGGRAEVGVCPGFPHAGVRVVDLLEGDDPETASLAPLRRQGEEVWLALGPFQVVTLRFRRAEG